MQWQRKGLKQLSKMKIPFKAPSLIDKSRPYFSGIRRFGVKQFWNFVNDPFHTLLNMPWGRFVFVFFATYIIMFMLFAFLFWAQGNNCVVNMEGKFAHALWLSSRTASTLGFDTIRPNPECAFTNFCVMLQVIASSLINFIMLGVVFARFSAPFKRASTIRFSKTAVCHRHPSGYWCISLRVANLRKHQILQPSIRMVVTAVDSITPSNYMFEHLKVEGAYQQETNLELGFPANLVHVMRPDSYLYNLSLLEMDTRMMEVLVFVDGIDAMTSKHMSARCAYATAEITLNHVHVPLNLEMRGKQLGMNFEDFDLTEVHWEALEREMQAGTTGTRAVQSTSPTDTTGAMWQLRHQTFRKLAEKFPLLAPPPGQHAGNPSAVAAAAAAAEEAAAEATGHDAAAAHPLRLDHVALGVHAPSPLRPAAPQEDSFVEMPNKQHHYHLHRLQQQQHEDMSRAPEVVESPLVSPGPAAPLVPRRATTEMAQLPATNPHLLDPSVSGLAPYAQHPAVVMPRASLPLQPEVSLGSGGGAPAFALPTSTSPAEPTLAAGYSQVQQSPPPKLGML